LAVTVTTVTFAPSALARARPCLRPLSASSEPSVAMRMCLYIFTPCRVLTAYCPTKFTLSTSSSRDRHQARYRHASDARPGFGAEKTGKKPWKSMPLQGMVGDDRLELPTSSV